MIRLLYIDLFCGAGGTTTGVEAARIGGKKCAKVIGFPIGLCSHRHPERTKEIHRQCRRGQYGQATV